MALTRDIIGGLSIIQGSLATNPWIFQIGGNRWGDYVVIATVVITSVLTVANVERANLEPARFPP